MPRKWPRASFRRSAEEAEHLWARCAAQSLEVRLAAQSLEVRLYEVPCGARILEVKTRMEKGVRLFKTGLLLKFELVFQRPRQPKAALQKNHLKPFALQALAFQLARAANGLGPLAGLAF